MLKLQVGVAHGEVVEVRTDCFGDAVNVAARLLDHTGDNGTLVTSTGHRRARRGRVAAIPKPGQAPVAQPRRNPCHLYLLEALHAGDVGDDELRRTETRAAAPGHPP